MTDDGAQYSKVIAPGAFGTEPVTVPVRVNFQGAPIGEAVVQPDGSVTARIWDDDSEVIARLVSRHLPEPGSQMSFSFRLKELGS